jgi:hypothetical protein
MVMDVKVPWQVINVLTTSLNISFWRKTQLRGLDLYRVIKKSVCTCLWVRSHPRGHTDKILLVDNLYTYANRNVSYVGFSYFQHSAASFLHRCTEIIHSPCTSDVLLCVMTCSLVGLCDCASGAAVHPGKSYFQIYVGFWRQNRILVVPKQYHLRWLSIICTCNPHTIFPRAPFTWNSTI